MYVTSGARLLLPQLNFLEVRPGGHLCQQSVPFCHQCLLNGPSVFGDTPGHSRSGAGARAPSPPLQPQQPDPG